MVLETIDTISGDQLATSASKLDSTFPTTSVSKTYAQESRDTAVATPCDSISSYANELAASKGVSGEDEACQTATPVAILTPAVTEQREEPEAATPAAIDVPAADPLAREISARSEMSASQASVPRVTLSDSLSESVEIVAVEEKPAEEEVKPEEVEEKPVAEESKLVEEESKLAEEEPKLAEEDAKPVNEVAAIGSEAKAATDFEESPAEKRQAVPELFESLYSKTEEFFGDMTGLCGPQVGDATAEATEDGKDAAAPFSLPDDYMDTVSIATERAQSIMGEFVENLSFKKSTVDNLQAEEAEEETNDDPAAPSVEEVEQDDLNKASEVDKKALVEGAVEEENEEDIEEKVKKPAAFKNILLQRSISGKEEDATVAAPSVVDPSVDDPSVDDPSDAAPTDAAPSIENGEQDMLNKAAEGEKEALDEAAVEEKNKKDIEEKVKTPAASKSKFFRRSKSGKEKSNKSQLKIFASVVAMKKVAQSSFRRQRSPVKRNKPAEKEPKVVQNEK